MWKHQKNRCFCPALLTPGFWLQSCQSDRNVPSLCHWSASSGTSSPGWCSRSPECPGQHKNKTKWRWKLSQTRKKYLASGLSFELPRASHQPRQDSPNVYFGTQYRTTFRPDTISSFSSSGSHKSPCRMLTWPGQLLESGSCFVVQPHHISCIYLSFTQKSLTISMSNNVHGWVSHHFPALTF